MATIEERYARTNAIMDARIRKLVGELRHPVTVKHASELSPAERRRYGFAEDFTARPSTLKRRRPR
jgi:hypothetical protein